MSALPYLSLNGIDVDFPIYQGADRLLRKALMRSTVGGWIRKSEQSGRIVVHGLSSVSARYVVATVSPCSATTALARRPRCGAWSASTILGWPLRASRQSRPAVRHRAWIRR